MSKFRGQQSPSRAQVAVYRIRPPYVGYAAALGVFSAVLIAATVFGGLS